MYRYSLKWGTTGSSNWMFDCAQITRAYRKRALKCHPDKNPGDQKAADLFQKLSQAYDILLDAAARAAYDSWLKAKQAAKQRNAELSAKRRKMKESEWVQCHCW